ncbi:MAG: excinuclease ABC subunit UvrC [Clostridia bacterium]|nr:excinuclease ABC subunit UvrC [Clostridia bacterium]
MFDIKENLKKLPLKPGVYLMKNTDGHIIYVGKAKKLKNRVSSYFINKAGHNLKTKVLVENIYSFDFIVTNTEAEALILENNLIKKYMPKYNILLKDDKTYPFLKVTVSEDFPRIIKVRKVKKDKDKYFGPYVSGYELSNIMKIIYSIWNVRTCNRNLPKDIGKARPCLNYHIKKCDAPCDGKISSEDYKKIIDEVITFLGGNKKDIISKLTEKMAYFSEKLDYERAMEIRDNIITLKGENTDQAIENVNMESKDIVGIYGNVVNIFFVRNGKMVGKDEFVLENENGEPENTVLNQFIKMFYIGALDIPKTVVVSEEIEDLDVIMDILKEETGKKIVIKKPERGEKLNFVNLAVENSKIKYENIHSKIDKINRNMSELESIFETKISRIESYDISNTSGVETVGSMIVYEDGKPSRKNYRKYKIKTVVGQNDYASMEEVVSRRFKNEELELPELILVDGGKGQINIVKKVIDELNVKSVIVAGMVKDDKHRTRGLLFNDKEINISRELLRFLTEIQDEVHRFAIDYHRSRMIKSQKKSELDKIKGVGEKTKFKLVKHFKSLKNIKNVGIDDLEAVVNKDVAKNIYDYFNKGE